VQAGFKPTVVASLDLFTGVNAKAVK